MKTSRAGEGTVADGRRRYGIRRLPFKDLKRGVTGVILGTHTCRDALKAGKLHGEFRT